MNQPPTKGGGFGSFALGTMKLTLRVALNSAINNPGILNYVTSKMYVDETGQDWSTVSVAERALWQQRVRSVVTALADTVNL